MKAVYDSCSKDWKTLDKPAMKRTIKRAIINEIATRGGRIIGKLQQVGAEPIDEIEPTENVSHGKSSLNASMSPSKNSPARRSPMKEQSSLTYSATDSIGKTMRMGADPSSPQLKHSSAFTFVPPRRDQLELTNINLNKKMKENKKQLRLSI